MRFFNRAWVDGELDNEEWDRRLTEYRAYWEDVLPSLPERIRVLGQVSIHDAKVRLWDHDREKRCVTAELIIGDLQRTYSTYRIVFHDATVTAQPEAEPDSWLMSDDTELLYDEIEPMNGGRFEWRVIAWPTGEIVVGPLMSA